MDHSLSPTSHDGSGAAAFIDNLTELSNGEVTGTQAPADQLVGPGGSENGFRHVNNSLRTAVGMSGPTRRIMEDRVHMEAFSETGAFLT